MAVAEKNETIKKALSELRVISADEKQRMLYNARLKAERDARMWQNAARREGLEEGMQQGMEKVIELLNKGISLQDVQKMLGIKPLKA